MAVAVAAMALMAAVVEAMSLPVAAAGSGRAGGGGGANQDTLDIPNSAVGSVIGKSGQTIQDFERQSGARIQVCMCTHADRRKRPPQPPPPPPPLHTRPCRLEHA